MWYKSIDRYTKIFLDISSKIVYNNTMVEKKKKQPYIDKVKFYEALKEYRRIYDDAVAEGNEPPEMPKYIGECFIAIGRNFAKKPQYFEYTWKDDMINDGVLDCVKYWRTFDPEKSTEAFSYFTQCFYNAFSRKLNEENKQKYIKYKTCENKGIFGEYDKYIVESDSGELSDDDKQSSYISYENVSTYVSEYEEKIKRKKDEQKMKTKSSSSKNQKSLF